MYVRVSYTMDSLSAQIMMTALAAKLTAPAMMGFMAGVVTPYIQGRIKNRFAGEGDDVSGKWLPLAQATVDIRKKAGFPGEHPINVRTGQMAGYLFFNSGRVVSAGGITDLEYPNPGAIGTQLGRKLMTAQMGSASPPTPPRPVLGFNMSDNVALTAAVAGYLTI